MFTGRKILIAWATLALCAGPALAADDYFGGPNRPSTIKPRTTKYAPSLTGRKVPVYQGETASAQSPSRLVQHDAIAIPPLPSTDDQDEMPLPSGPARPGNKNSQMQPEQLDDQLGGQQFGGQGGSCQSCNNGSCGTGGGSCGSCQSCGSCGPCACAPIWQHRTNFFGEFLYLRATNDNVAHAMLQNGVGGPGTTPDGRVGVVDSNYQPGIRVGGFYALDQCSSIGATFTNYQSHATDSLTANPDLGDTIASLVLHPASTNAGSTSSFVTASHDIDFRTVDADYRRLLAGGMRSALNYTIGARYGKLQQDFEQQGSFTPPLGNLQTNTSIKFEGAGLRTGFDGQRQIGNGRLSAYGKGFISVLFGQFNSNFIQQDTTSTIVQANSNWRDERVVPVLEYEVGASWTSCGGRLHVTAGYYTAFWFNTVTTSQYIQAVQTANYVNLGQTIAFDGFVSRLEYRF